MRAGENLGGGTGKCVQHLLWVAAALLLLASVTIAAYRIQWPAGRCTIPIDTNGAARLGGVLRLENGTVRSVALKTAARLNGGSASIATSQATPMSNLVETVVAMRIAGITSIVLHAESNPPDNK